MSFKNSLLLLLLAAPLSSAFRSPENTPKNVVLPNVKKLRDPEQFVSTQEPENKIEIKETQARPVVRRTKWGMDNEYEEEYWFDERIHVLGNVGFWGALHAAIAPFSTKMIDMLAYNGTDVRQLVAEELTQKVKSSKTRVLDLCCGVGISTRALRIAFPEAEAVVGVDTSSEMISMARFLSSHLSVVKPWVQRFTQRARNMACVAATNFTKSNAEQTPFPGQSFDLITIMYAFHEAPREGRERILKEAHRLLEPGGTLAVIDICTDYQPSQYMLKGEPYVLEYQKNIHRQLNTFRGFAKVSYQTIVQGHVGMWVLKRSFV